MPNDASKTSSYWYNSDRKPAQKGEEENMAITRSSGYTRDTNNLNYYATSPVAVMTSK